MISRVPPAALVAALALGAGAASAQPDVVATFDEWQIRCLEPGPCALSQYVVAGDRDDIDLEILVWKAAGQEPMLQVRAPLESWLRAGIEVRVDAEAIGRMNFERCGFDGCFAEVLLDEHFLGLMRAGTTALFIFRLYNDPETGIGVPISLAGFTAGYEALAARP